MNRNPISKRVRFEIFKRDNFACQYCGQTPPAVVLEIDHIVAVVDGGSDETHNLITACFDCNRGKGAIPLAERPTPEDLRAKRSLMRERIEQAEAYELMLQEQRRAEEDAVDGIIAIYEDNFDGWTLLDKTRISIRQFLRKLPRAAVTEAMEIACDRMSIYERVDNRSAVFHYFCGICWRMIKEGRDE
jgi:hypothetical protein